MHPAEQLQGQTSQCVRARVGGEEVASSSSGRRSGSGVGSDAGIYQWMDDGAVLANRYSGSLSTGGRRFVGAICGWLRADGRV